MGETKKAINAEDFEIEMGKRLQDLRKKKGKTQDEVAEALGLGGRTNVKQWETWDRHLKAKDLIKLADYYDVSVDYLLGRTPEPRKDLELLAICDYTGLAGNTVELLHNWAEDIKKHGEIYRQAPIKRIDDLLSCAEGLLFLSALDRVKSEVVLSGEILKKPGSSPDDLTDALEHLQLSLYRLTVRAGELANALYDTQKSEKALDEAYWNMMQEAIEEVRNGKHQEN